LLDTLQNGGTQAKTAWRRSCAVVRCVWRNSGQDATVVLFETVQPTGLQVALQRLEESGNDAAALTGFLAFADRAGLRYTLRHRA